jgi:putative tryptophan/tyrosine transport system substrate-binding protein
MRRREFIALGCAAMVWPADVRAQQAVPVIGFLGSESPELWAQRVDAFRQGLDDIGYTDGKNVRIEYRWAKGNNDQFPTLEVKLLL